MDLKVSMFDGIYQPVEPCIVNLYEWSRNPQNAGLTVVYQFNAFSQFVLVKYLCHTGNKYLKTLVKSLNKGSKVYVKTDCVYLDNLPTWDRDKVYGYSEDYMLKYLSKYNKFPEDNEIMVESLKSERLTVDEIHKLLPCQLVCLTDVEWKDSEFRYDSDIISGIVKYYHCSDDVATKLKLDGKVEAIIDTFPSVFDYQFIAGIPARILPSFTKEELRGI